MPIQYYYSEPDNVLCVKIKVPVVLAEEEVQVVIDNVATLPGLAQKVDHIDARLDEFAVRPVFVHEDGNRWTSIIKEKGWERFGWKFDGRRRPVVKKLLVEGVLHKQIFYVDKKNVVKHVGEDIPFSKEITLAEPQPVVNEEDVFVQLHKKKVDMRWKLKHGSRLEQTGVLIFRIKAVEERQIFVQVCPQLDERCPRGVNIIKDGSFETWGTDTEPVFWGASNVVRAGGGAVLGAAPGEPASLFQIIDREFPGIFPACRCRLCFDAKEIPGYMNAQGGIASYSLTAELSFIDQNGKIITTEIKSWNASQISDGSFTSYCLNAVSPGETREALVRFIFEPINPVRGSKEKYMPPYVPPYEPPCEPPAPPPHKPPHKPPAPPKPAPVNTSAVLIDNVRLECVR